MFYLSGEFKVTNKDGSPISDFMSRQEFFSTYGPFAGAVAETGSLYLNLNQLATLGVEGKLSGSPFKTGASAAAFRLLSGINLAGKVVGAVSVPVN